MKFHVSKSGSDLNPGTEADPFGTVQHGVNQLAEGDELVIHGGVYVERVEIRELGRKREPVATSISAADGDVVVIDGSGNETEQRPQQLFRSAGNDDWDRVGDTDEFVSRLPLLTGTVVRGSFLDRPRYARLITYDRLQDLRADNQKFGPLPEDAEPTGPIVDGRYPSAPMRPWVYLGPGIFREDSGTVHVRLSPTTHDHPRVQNYTGPSDPRQLSLAITTVELPTLLIKNCGGIVIRGLTVRGGGGYAVSIEQSVVTRLDQLTILAGSDGVHIHDDSTGTWISDCVVDGGLPPWLFRSDLKDEYTITGPDPQETNRLAKLTIDSLLRCTPNTVKLLVSNCEFVNGHDLQLAGTEIEFRSCWLDNINDDVFFIGDVAQEIRIHHNVIERVLTCLNLIKHESADGSVYFYRNLVDLRRPTIGRRPHPHPEIIDQLRAEEHGGDNGDDDEFDELDLSLLRFGQFFKRKPPDPALSIFHNTFLLAEQKRAAAYPHFFRYDGTSRRRVVNNIFVAINPAPEFDKPVAFLPIPDHELALSDGNCYHRIGQHDKPLVAHQRYMNGKERGYDTLQDMKESDYFSDSKDVYPPGTENTGIESDPGFRLMQPWPLNEVIPVIEDFRLADASPVHGHGVDLMTPQADLGDLADLDQPLSATAPEIGCYRTAAALEVGVAGRHRFPHPPQILG